MHDRRVARIILFGFSTAAILYNSWPIGYIVNSRTARYDLASQLDSPRQPYFWIFLLGDVLVGLSLIVVSLLIRFKLKGVLWSKNWTVVISGLFVFGLFTATSAASANTCLSGTIHMCAVIHKQTLGPDGLESTLAAFGLLVSLVGASFLSQKNSRSKFVNKLTMLTAVAWAISGLGFLLAADQNYEVHLAQQVLLILTGIALMVIGFSIYKNLDYSTAVED